MAYTAMTAAEVASGKPVTTGLLAKVKADLDYLYGIIGSIGIIQIPNGSFEIDSVGDGNPDAWTKNLYAGGSGTLYTTSPAHGAKSWSFTHPGGASNGGGYLDSDYIEVTELHTIWLSFTHWATAAGMKNKLQIRYFDKAKSELGAGSPYDLYNSTANPTSAKPFTLPFLPPATTRFIKIRLVGGFTDSDVAGTAYFDDIRILCQMMLVAGTIPLAASNTERTTVELSYTKLKEIVVGAGGVLRIAFDLKTNGGGSAVARIYRNGVAVGTEQTDSTGSYVTQTEDIAGWQPGDLCQLYAKTSGGTTADVCNFKLSASTSSGFCVALD
jgi:hypothetical protein